ncbi:MAG: PRC-barrel domain-containing protein [Tepidibacillus sp.]
MRKTEDVIGLPVIDLSSGKKIGVTKDVYFDENGELKGIAVESDGLFGKRQYLAFEHIGAIGDDAITVGTKRFLTSLDLIEQYYGIYSGKKRYKGLPVFTTNGHELGQIQDVYFMEEMGKILGYELSDGFLTDVTEGRKVIQYPKRMVLGEDAMIVPQDEVQDVIMDEESI